MSPESLIEVYTKVFGDLDSNPSQLRLIDHNTTIEFTPDLLKVVVCNTTLTLVVNGSLFASRQLMSPVHLTGMYWFDSDFHFPVRVEVLSPDSDNPKHAVFASIDGTWHTGCTIQDAIANAITYLVSSYYEKYTKHQAHMEIAYSDYSKLCQFFNKKAKNHETL